MKDYSSDISAIVLDIHNYFVDLLALSIPFQSIDPPPGQSYGLFSPAASSENNLNQVTFKGVLLVSASFATYWDAVNWTIATAMKVKSSLPKIKNAIDGRGVLVDVEQLGDVSLGRPRSPLSEVAGQRETIWTVDVIANLQIVTSIQKDLMCGYV